MGFASTATFDLLVLLQNQTQYIQSIEKENARLKSLEIENERLRHALLHHQRMRFGTKSEAFNTLATGLFAKTTGQPMRPTCSNGWNRHREHAQATLKPNVPVRVVEPCPPFENAD
ncbi:MAG: hypothetical protein IPG70_13060 [Moraxellaceae bacterium]|nr:hypothetical protein [Moraxellaceae bacterium]